MMQMAIKQVLQALDGNLALGMAADEQETRLEGVSIDSRTLQAGNLFIAVKGARFDGHDYLQQAVDAGAAAVLVQHQSDALQVPQIVVDDTYQALVQLARYWRQVNKWLVVAITGSNGKTTVKEMAARVLATKYRSWQTQGNLNNEFGVPLTILSCPAQVQALVLEMGANHAGEIAHLSTLAQPDIALVNNIAPAHIEGFGSLQGVAEAKAEIFLGLKAEGTAIINADSDFAAMLKSSCSQSCIDYSLQQPATLTASKITDRNFEVCYLNHRTLVSLKVAGRHNIANALAAIAIGLAAGIDVAAAAAALQGFDGVAGRLQIKQGLRGSIIIDDSYNANLASMKAGIDYLLSRPGKHWALLGEMAELGEHSEAMHRQLAEYAREQGVEQLFVYGSMGELMCRAFGENCCYQQQRQPLVEQIAPLLDKQVNLLIKGSRSAAMERFVEAFTHPGGTS